MKDEPTGNVSETNHGTDWDKLRSMSNADIHAAIESDPEATPTDEDFWKTASVVMPSHKETITLQLDAEVLEWFRRESNYQAHINEILQDYIKNHTLEAEKMEIKDRRMR